MEGSHKQADEERLYEKIRQGLLRQRDKIPSWKMFKKGGSTLPVIFQSAENPKNQYHGLKECLEQGWAETGTHLMLEGIGGIGKTIALLNLADSMDIPVIYIPLYNWARDLCGDSSNNLIGTYIKNKLLDNSEDDYNRLKSVWRKEWKEKPSILLILDGVNELSEKNRERIAAEINQIDEIYPGVQMILASRYDFTPEIRPACKKIKVMTLNRQNIVKYLEDRNISLPKETSKLWKIIDTPFMLELYAEGKEKREKSGDSVKPLEDRGSETAGGIIQDYLKKEIDNYHKNNNERVLYAQHMISVYAIAPYIAYQMLKENVFAISYEEFINYIEKACCWYDQNLKNGYVPKDIKYQHGLRYKKTAIDSEDAKTILEEKICLFYLSDALESDENTVHFIHQHFRDCLAAIHLCNTAEMLADDTKGVPEEWNISFDRYVMGFLADLLEKRFWNNVWEAGRKVKKTSTEFTDKMLELHKQAYGNNISDVNFRGMDLTQVSLSGFCLNHCYVDEQNPHSQKNERKFAGAVIGDRTISGEGHTMDVTAVSWSCSEKSVFMSASHDCTIRIWDINDKSSNVLPRKHANYIRCAEWSPADADKMASAGDNQELICWEREKNSRKWNSRILARLDDWIYGLSWSPDGRRIACGERSGRVSVIDLQGRRANFSQKHKEYVRRISWAPGSRGIFASGSDEGTVCLWNADPEKVEKQPLVRLELYGKRVTGLAWLEDGRYLMVSDTDCYMIMETSKLLSCGGQQTISLLNKEDLLLKKEKRKNISAIAVRRKRDKDFVAVFYAESVDIFYTTCIREGNFEFISVDTTEWNEEIVSSSQWNAECDRLICGCDNGEICYIDVKAGEVSKDRIDTNKIVDGCGCSVRCTDWTKDGKRLAAGYDDRRVRIWDVSERRCLAVLDGHRESIKSIAWSPDNRLLASGDNAAGLRIWDLNSLEKDGGKFLEEKSLGTGGINAVIWLDQNRILCGSDDSMLYLWDRTEPLEHSVHKMSAHEKRVYSLALSPDKKFAVSVGNDRLICLWDTQKGICVQKTDSFHEDAIRDVSWFPDGSGIATGSNDRTIICRKFDKGSERLIDTYARMPKEHRNFIYSVACTGNNRYIVSGSTDSRVGFWDRKNKMLHFMGQEHGDFVWDVSAGPEIAGRYYAASASSDGTIKIWDVTELQDESIHSCSTLKVIPGINLVGCDFSGAIFHSETGKEDELQELILVNGGIIDELSEEELRDYMEEKELQRPEDSFENTVDIYTEKELCKSLIHALTDVQGEKLFFGADEDTINRDVCRALSTKGYHAEGQVSAGKGKGGKNAGELDILIKDDDGLPWAIIEGIKLGYLDRNNLQDHIGKIVDPNRYNPFGCRYGNLLIYYMTSSKATSDTFASFCSRFRDYLNNYNYNQIHLTDLAEGEKRNLESYTISGKIESEIGDIILHFYVYHIQNS